jgi:NADH-dependent peroxiredoxin subunit F
MQIKIYSKQNCQFCTKAKHMLKSIGLDYEEKMMESFESPQAMMEDIGKQVRSMPQIKIDDKLIGGYNQLVEHFAELGKVNYKGEKI